MTRALLVIGSLFTWVGILVTWVVTFAMTMYMAVGHLPLSFIQTVLLVVSAPNKVGLRTFLRGLVLWLLVMTVNQCLALIWFLGYGVIRDWAYSTSFGDTVSAAYFVSGAVASTVLIYKRRHRFYRTLSSRPLADDLVNVAPPSSR